MWVIISYGRVGFGENGLDMWVIISYGRVGFGEKAWICGL